MHGNNRTLATGMACRVFRLARRRLRSSPDAGSDLTGSRARPVDRDGHWPCRRGSARGYADARARPRGLHRRRPGESVTIRRQRRLPRGAAARHRVKRLGCSTLVECTPAYLGRDPRLLRRLSEASELHILSNTGYYGAANDKHLPAHAFDETAEQLAARWIRESERGIDDTGIKPAFMKIGVDQSPLSAVDAELVRAAALTHRETGLAIASHTGSGAAALEELDLIERAGVPASAFIWVHAQAERDATFHARAARRGAWVEFDGLSQASVTRHVELVRLMKEQGLLGHVLLSHDAGWYRVGEPGGGQFRPYDTLFTTFIPALKAAGFADAEVRQLIVAHPRQALARSTGTMIRAEIG